MGVSVSDAECGLDIAAADQCRWSTCREVAGRVCVFGKDDAFSGDEGVDNAHCAKRRMGGGLEEGMD